MVLKDALAHLGPYQTLTSARYNDLYYKFKKIPIQAGSVWWLPIVSSKYRDLYQFCYVKIFGTNWDGNLLLLDDPGRVRNPL